MIARHRLTILGIAVLLAAFALGGGRQTLTLMTSSRNTTSSFSTAASFIVDTEPPAIHGSVIVRSTGYVAGFIRQGGTFHVYANVVDQGTPATGVASVTANLSDIAAGAAAVPLVAGTYSAGGVAYGWRSAAVTAITPLPEGTRGYSITALDSAANSASRTDQAVVVDNSAPRASDVQTANGASTVGRPELGDTVTFTFSEPIDPFSVLANWTGAATDVVVRITDGGLLGSDVLTVRNAANNVQLPLGSVSLNGTSYVSANRDFGASGTPSSMVMSNDSIVITLGTPSGTTGTQLIGANMTWTPSASATDWAGNDCLTTSGGEQDVLPDVEF